MAAILSLMACALLAVAVVLWIFNRAPAAVTLLALPLVLVVVTNPRLALYQFVFCCFLPLVLVESVPVLLIDLSAVVVLLAAVLDVLLSDRMPRRVPQLALWYGALLIALVAAGVFGFAPDRAIRPVLRVFSLAVTFLSLYRLSRHVEASELLRLFFWLTVAHSLVALVPFIASGGAVRSFGFALRILDELAMLALPIGIGYFLWSDRHRFSYLVGSVLVGIALVGTQSRAPIAFGALSTVFVILVSRRHRPVRFGAPGTINTRGRSAGIRRRIGLLLTLGVATPLALVAFKPDILVAVYERFDSLVTFEASGTLLLRLQLWERAITAFLDHPWLGIGPGMFQRYGDIYAQSHLNPFTTYISGLSAHNLTLHYLAETGIVGTAVLLGFFVAQFRLSRTVWHGVDDDAHRSARVALYAIGFLLLGTTLVEAGWMFGGQAGFLSAFLLALIARGYEFVRERREAGPRSS